MSVFRPLSGAAGVREFVPQSSFAPPASAFVVDDNSNDLAFADDYAPGGGDFVPYDDDGSALSSSSSFEPNYYAQPDAFGYGTDVCVASLSERSKQTSERFAERFVCVLRVQRQTPASLASGTSRRCSLK